MSAKIYKTELVLHARSVHLLPHLSVTRLPCGLDSRLVLPEADEKHFSPTKDIGNVGRAEEVLRVVGPFGLGVDIGELGHVHLGLAKRLAGHLEVTDEVVVLAGTVGNLDDFNKVGGVPRLDVRIWNKRK